MPTPILERRNEATHQPLTQKKRTGQATRGFVRPARRIAIKLYYYLVAVSAYSSSISFIGITLPFAPTDAI